MEQQLIARRDEIARAYQLGALLQQVAPKPFWQNNWRVQVSVGITLALALFFLIIGILADIFPGGGATLTVFLIMAVLFGGIGLLFFVGWRQFYITSSGWVYVYTHGLIYLPRRRQLVGRQFVASWQQLGYPGVEVQPGYRNRGPLLHVELRDGTSINFESIWFDIKALEFLIESTRSRSWQPPGTYQQGGQRYYQPPPSYRQPPGGQPQA